MTVTNITSLTSVTLPETNRPFLDGVLDVVNNSPLLTTTVVVSQLVLVNQGLKFSFNGVVGQGGEAERPTSGFLYPIRNSVAVAQP